MVKAIIRWSGLALIAGALLLGAAMVMISLRLPGQLPTPLVSMILLVASLLIMLALPGMYAWQSEAAGWSGLVGHVLLEVGIVIVIMYAAAPLFNPELTRLGDSVVAFLLGIALLLGIFLTAIATLRAEVYPRSSGIRCSRLAPVSCLISSWPSICLLSLGSLATPALGWCLR